MVASGARMTPEVSLDSRYSFLIKVNEHCLGAACHITFVSGSACCDLGSIAPCYLQILSSQSIGPDGASFYATGILERHFMDYFIEISGPVWLNSRLSNRVKEEGQGGDRWCGRWVAL